MTLPASGPLAMTDIQTEFGGTNPIGLNEYYAGGGLVPAGTSGTYGAVPSSGALSIQNFYGTSQFIPKYIEDVFSTYLYTGNNSTQTITNGIDLAGEGGMVWMKSRSSALDNVVFDTARGTNSELRTNATNGNISQANGVTAFNAAGFSLGNYYAVNDSSTNFVSWTFRKQPKFFDVVTYTGNGVAGRTVAHNLGSVPACMIVKRTDAAGGWYVYHTSLGATKNLQLSSTLAAATRTQIWNDTAPTSTVFSLGTDTDVNGSGGTYVAYLYAHDAGGFGESGTDNVISCGSLTADGSGAATVNLGYEAQWVLVKRTDNTQDWTMFDVMRGMSLGSFAVLYPNTSGAEGSFAIPNIVFPTSTGFGFGAGALSNSGQYIYIAIRRGPMKVPTSGTSVFSPNTATNTEGQGTVKTTNFPVDLQITKALGGGNGWTVDRLRGVSTTNTDTGPSVLITNETDAQYVNTFAITRAWNNTGFQISSAIGNSSQIYWNFRRAPGFFDEVCYTGTGSATTVAHNLGVAPELMIVKARSISGFWYVFVSSLGADRVILLNSNGIGASSSSYWNSTMPTSTVFSLNDVTAMNGAGSTFVAYLFASCPGVSKVGSYTGTGTTQQINCGFTAGARFVLIKRTDSTGDWVLWDSSRGMVAGTDPRLALNSTAAEVNANWVYATSGGFEIVTSDATVNASGGSYIFLSIA